jgi:hypothetical protein
MRWQRQRDAERHLSTSTHDAPSPLEALDLDVLGRPGLDCVEVLYEPYSSKLKLTTNFMQLEL